MTNVIGLDKNHSWKAGRSCKIHRHFKYQYLLSPHPLHVSGKSDANAQLLWWYKGQMHMSMVIIRMISYIFLLCLWYFSWVKQALYCQSLDRDPDFLHAAVNHMHNFSAKSLHSSDAIYCYNLKNLTCSNISKILTQDFSRCAMLSDYQQSCNFNGK